MGQRGYAMTQKSFIKRILKILKDPSVRYSYRLHKYGGWGRGSKVVDEYSSTQAALNDWKAHPDSTCMDDYYYRMSMILHDDTLPDFAPLPEDLQLLIDKGR